MLVVWLMRNRCGADAFAGVAVLSVKGRLRSFRGGDKPFWRTFRQSLVYSIAAIGLASLVLAVTIWICQLYGYDEIQQHVYLKELESNPPLMDVVTLVAGAVVVVPVLEELFFRGILQSFFIAALGYLKKTLKRSKQEDTSDDQETELSSGYRWLGIYAASVIFAMTHRDIQHWPALFVLAMCFGYAYERHGTLLLPIMMHILFNLLPITMTIILAPGS